MSRFRYYLDENVSHGPIVAVQLQRRGVDAITAVDAGRAGQGVMDQDQLDYAIREGRVMVTEDVHFRPLLPHGGLVVMQSPLGIGDYILYLELLAEQYGPGDLNDQVHYCMW